MKKTKHARALSGLLALLTLVPMLAACASTDDNDTGKSGEKETTAETTTVETTTAAFDNVERFDYDGAVFRIISDKQDDRHTDFLAEAENGDTLNDLVYRRNSVVEESYNITIEVVGEGTDKILSSTKTNVTAGDNPYDIVMPNCNASSLTYGGYMLAWNDIDTLQLDAEWWDQAAIADMSVGNRIYMLTGDISPNGLLTSECLLFNKQLFENRGMEEPYQAAFDGKWTFDMFETLTRDLTEDLNGDGELDDKNDLFSYTLWNDGGQALYFGMDATLSEKDSNDIPVIKYSDEKMIDVYTRIYNLIKNNKANFSKTDHEQSFKVFNDGRAYFCGITFQKIGTFLRNMEQDFGILPIPKYSEAQELYLTNVSPALSFAMIAKTTEDTDYAGIICDALAASAKDIITPTLYDVIAGTKNVRDESSPEIMQMIIHNRVYDPVCMYMLTGSMFVRDLLTKDTPDIASYMASIESADVKKLDSIIEEFGKVE